MTEEKRKGRSARDVVVSYDGPPVRIMEVCGTHTHEIFRLGLRTLLPPQVTLISGPGCPVCVTPADYIDEAIWLALERGVTVATFGDLIRVPGSRGSLQDARARGARVQMVYAPVDAVEYAAAHPEEEVVFLSVGFETTTPASCLALSEAEKRGIDNFSLLAANKTMPAAYAMLKDSADVFLYPGHVNAITGTALCESLVEQGISGVVTGFRANEILRAFAVILTKYPEGKPFFVNAYRRVVTREGSPAARALVYRYMEETDAEWRGLGVLPGSGLRIRKEYARFDARVKYAVPKMEGRTNRACRCGEVLRGVCLPTDCPLFGKGCTPRKPAGACMVSGEGACAAYYRYGEGERTL